MDAKPAGLLRERRERAAQVAEPRVVAQEEHNGRNPAACNSACAFWPAPVEPRVDVHNATPVLIVQATGDPVAAYREGVGLHRTMTASRLVTLRDVIVHGAFTVPSSCVSQAVETYLRDGGLPATDLTCRAE